MEVLLTTDDKGRRATGVGTTPERFDLTAYVGHYVQIWGDEDGYIVPTATDSQPTFDTSTEQKDSDISAMPKRYKANDLYTFVYVRSEQPFYWVRTQGASGATFEAKKASPVTGA